MKRLSWALTTANRQPLVIEFAGQRAPTGLLMFGELLPPAMQHDLPLLMPTAQPRPLPSSAVRICGATGRAAGVS
jgi:hypothetical protein